MSKNKSDDKKKKHDEGEKKPETLNQFATPNGNGNSATNSSSSSVSSSVGVSQPTSSQNTPQAQSQVTTPQHALSSLSITDAELLESKKKEEDEKKRKSEELQRKTDEEKSKREEQEKRKRQQDEEERKKNSSANQELNEEFEIQSLEQMGKSIPNNLQDLFNFFPTDVYASYDKLQSFSRDLNTTISHPEIVFVGPRTSGKSSLIEAFIGRSLNIVGQNGCSKRPIYFQFVNNIECEVPKITVKRDSNIKDFDHDIVIPLEQLNDNIFRRNQQLSDDPIYITIETKSSLNLTIIDTPGLLIDSNSQEQQKIDNIVQSILKPNNRLIIAVENCGDWSQMSMLTFIKKVDPELSRSTFVFTKFFNQIQDFTSTRSVNRFLAGTMSEIKSFFVTIPNHKIRARFSEPARFQEKLQQAYKRDMYHLEQIQYDKRYERSIGVNPFRKYILNIVWKSYQDGIPRILKHLRAKRQTAEKTLNDLQKQTSSLSANLLRSISSNYTVTFLQINEKLLSGTSEGNPSVNGQTLEEEKHQQGDGGDWVDIYNRPIKFDPEEWGIPYWNSKLYGGQQFERLMAEFKAVCENTKISEVTMDDVATAAGINKLNNIPNYAWAASDLSQQKSQEAFVPLIEQLCERAVYIMKRLTEVSDKIIDQRRKSRISGPNTNRSAIDIDNIGQYPYFTHYVKDLYYKFIEQTAKICKEKCMDEFYSTRTIYWELTEHPDQSLPFNRNDHQDTKQAVDQLANQLFDSIRQRITKNVLLKFYNFFLVPMQTELWNEIQSKITCLQNDSLEQLFEVQATKELLLEDEKKQQAILEKYSQHDEIFIKSAAMFSHPLQS
ncbi:dynamin like protein [Tieghemostelium lacteum]|uniref:Dynamin like protein n=1 Tax=Tieghemostelium lacteum TaxID=361077 RepID=A0A151Z8H7_TIELA|nr:dynamin like protein [Tieghemostelium lacteum]|eukprot:KYQ90260.1 dynamin like protein [Tieghemostelium lacteum]